MPDLPPRRPNRPPRVHPNLIVREHVERDGVYVRSLIPNGPPHYFRMTKTQHQAAMFFDGNRSYAEVAECCRRQLGISVTEEDLRGFAEMLDREEFFYWTPQEESEIIAHQLTEKRHEVIKRKHANVDSSTIDLYFFNPDKVLGWLYQHFKWMYTPWWFAWSLLMVGVMFAILGSHWSMLWNDTLYFYNLTSQPASHILEFFGIFLVLSIMHESAHGMSCYHYGGRARRMGFFLIYLMPGCFCDASEAFVRANRWGRIVTVASGIWSEIVLCSYLSLVWWLTPPGSFLHDTAYIVILSGGILAVSFNWNPLARMDGYFIFCDLLHFHDLKGQSTRYMVAVTRKYLFRLPADIPALPPLRRLGFATYALLSGAYAYFLFGAICRIIYKIAYFYSPMWAFVPATYVGWLVFRSRIKKLIKFIRELYLDKKEIMRAHWKPLSAVAVVVALLLFLPLRHETVEEPFVLEPVHRAVLRAQVPGRVVFIGAREGQRVDPGTLIAGMSDLDADSQLARAEADYHTASARATEAQLRYGNFAAADQRQRQAADEERIARDRRQQLEVRTPIGGIVVTPRVHDLLNTYLGSGAEIAEVADVSQMRARVFVEEPEMRKLQHVTGTSLRMEGDWFAHHGEVAAISDTPREVPDGLLPPVKYQGINRASYFVVDILLPNADGHLSDGMTGTAKIYGPRRSAARLLIEPIFEAVSRRLW
ncbi:MAG: hypothetical protein ACRD3E_09785 [Terriglobales bacterium]